MKIIAKERCNVRNGVTLIELMIGIVLFSMALSLVVMGLGVSQKTLAVSNRQLPVAIILQNAMDSAARYIRESADVSVSGQGTAVTLTQRDNKVKTLSFSGDSLRLDSAVLQTGLASADFQVMQGGFTKYVVVTLKSSSEDATGNFEPKTLESSVALRDRVAVQPSPPPAVPTPPPVAAVPPAAVPAKTPDPPPPAQPLIPMVVERGFFLHGGGFGGGGGGREGAGLGGGGDPGGDILLMTSQGFQDQDAFMSNPQLSLIVFMLPASSLNTPYIDNNNPYLPGYFNGKTAGRFMPLSGFPPSLVWTGTQLIPAYTYTILLQKLAGVNP